MVRGGEELRNSHIIQPVLAKLSSLLYGSHFFHILSTSHQMKLHTQFDFIKLNKYKYRLIISNL